MFVHAIVQFLKRIWVAPQDPSSSNGGYWSLVPTQVSENDPLPVDIPLSSPLIDESSGTPHLLVRVSNNLSNPLFVKEKNIDTLFVAATTVTDANRDLLGSAATELPTLDGCMQYRKLVWFYFRAGGDSTTYRVLARATDHNGAPLGTGWQEIAPATPLPGEANTWGRIEIPSAGDGYYDQYRIEVQRTAGSNYLMTSKIVGVR